MSERTTDGNVPRHGRDDGRQRADGRSAGRGRPPLWLLILAGVLVVGLAVTAVLVLGNRGGVQEAPAAETVTLPPPTPTVDPVEREAGTAFYEALPSTVLQYALTETAENPPLLAAGALEGYQLIYSDGGSTTLVVQAGQWRDAASAQAVFDQRATAEDDAASTTESDAADAGDADAAEDDTDATADATQGPTLEVTEGAVEVDGAEAGRYLIVPRADGTGTAWWTNGTVLIQVDGPAEALPDFFAAFPL